MLIRLLKLYPDASIAPKIREMLNRQLTADGCRFVGPDQGWLSCRVQGDGRMSDPAEIIQAANRTIESEN